MLRVAICDDTPEDLDSIAASVKCCLDKRGVDADIMTFSHPDALLNVAGKNVFDIYYLDVIMPMMSGIEVGRELRQAHSKAQLVFLTTSDEFAVDAFALRAAHYLVKPCTQAQFDEATQRALDGLGGVEPRYLTVRSEGGTLRQVDVDEILYIESQNHRQCLNLKRGTCTEARRSLARLFVELEKIAPGQYIAPYKGHVVNQRAISSIEPKYLVLRDDTHIPIPRGSFHELQAQYMAFRFDGCPPRP